MEKDNTTATSHPEPIKHHYVPQCYLRNFEIDGYKEHVYAYKRNLTTISVNVKNIAAKNKFYTFIDKVTGGETNVIEKNFGRMESNSCPIINRIITNENIDISDQEKSILSEFIAFLCVRTISFEDWQRNMHASRIKQKFMEDAKHKDYFRKKIEKSGIKISESQFQKMRGSILNFDRHFTVKSVGGKGYLFKRSVELASDLAEIAFGKSWHLLISTSSRVFVTSDNPVSLQKVRGVPFHLNSGYLYGTILLSLSPKICLLIRNRPLGEAVVDIDREQVEAINRSIMRKSRNFIYSNVNSKDIKNTYDQIPTGEDSKVITEKINFAPFIMTRSPDIDYETITE